MHRITHRRISTVLCAAIASLVAVLALTYDAPPAAAHTLDPHRCNALAITEALRVPPATPLEVTTLRRACVATTIAHNCHHSAPRPVVRYATVKHRRASRTQRTNITTALNVGRAMHAPRNHQVALVAAMTQESSAYNLNHGHGTSVGILQLINLHGSVAWRMRIVNSAGWFLRGARAVDPRGRLAPGDLAQRVQRSAYPSAYRRWVPEARATYRRYLTPCLA